MYHGQNFSCCIFLAGLVPGFLLGAKMGFAKGLKRAYCKSLPLCLTSEERVFLLHLLRRTQEEAEFDMREYAKR